VGSLQTANTPGTKLRASVDYLFLFYLTRSLHPCSHLESASRVYSRCLHSEFTPGVYTRVHTRSLHPEFIPGVSSPSLLACIQPASPFHDPCPLLCPHCVSRRVHVLRAGWRMSVRDRGPRRDRCKGPSPPRRNNNTTRITTTTDHISTR
jgi:hypothetical protein